MLFAHANRSHSSSRTRQSQRSDHAHNFQRPTYAAVSRTSVKGDRVSGVEFMHGAEHTAYLQPRHLWDSCIAMHPLRCTPVYCIVLLLVYGAQFSHARVLRSGLGYTKAEGWLQRPTGAWPSNESNTTPTQEETQQFLRDNLEPRLRHWQQQALTPQVLETFAQELVRTLMPHQPDGMRYSVLAVLRNNTLQPLLYLSGQPVHGRFESLQELIRDSGLTFPDTAFIYNLDDLTLCHGAGSCAAPVFSANAHQDDLDLLMPATNHEFSLMSAPWSSKLPVAFGRASHNYRASDTPDGMSTRAYLALGSRRHPDKLDYGLTNLRFPHMRMQQHGFAKAPPVALEHHPRWKYLVSADGVVSAVRLDKLLLMNSVVLKEDSHYEGHYYRSLKPWVHYVPFTAGPAAVPSLLKAVDQLRADDAFAQGVSQAGQTFAAKFLTKQARAWYVQQLLLSYNDLFGAGVMESWVAQGGPEHLARRVSGLVKLRQWAQDATHSSS